MKFHRIIGKTAPALYHKAEENLQKVFLELAARYDNTYVGSGLGGDPFLFSLLQPVQHVCTQNIPTAATDGKRYYWNPKFILKLSREGLRIVCAHEAWHAIYMHPDRRGSRIPKLWNIAVDYIVNGVCMEDLQHRNRDAAAEFTKHLGRFMPLNTFCQFIQNPYAPIPGFEDILPVIQDPNKEEKSCELPAPNEDRELTPEEKKQLEKREKGVRFFYADPNLEPDMKRPEKIYDLLLSLLPKCPKCGSVGRFPRSQNKKPSKNQQPKNNQKKSDQQGESDQHDHSDHGDQCDCPSNSDQSGQNGTDPSDQGGSQPSQGKCDHCGDGADIFDIGGTVDDHIDSEESEEKMARRLSDAIETARRMAGYVPAALEDELGLLTAPKIKWSDIIRSKILKARTGNRRNDWTKFKSRPMFGKLLVPKRKTFSVNFGCLLDTSGSMSKDDMAYGVSQLMGLDERAEGTIVPCDAECYWDLATKIKKCNAEELTKVKVAGRGGTVFAQFFDNYEKNIGKCDFLIVLTDGALLDSDIAEMKDPGIPVYWVITSPLSFTAPFGYVYDLHY